MTIPAMGFAGGTCGVERVKQYSRHEDSTLSGVASHRAGSAIDKLLPSRHTRKLRVNWATDREEITEASLTSLTFPYLVKMRCRQSLMKVANVGRT